MDPRPSVPSVALEELVATLRTSLQPPPSPQSASASPMALPAAYAGEAAECGGFLLQLALYIEMQPEVSHRALQGSFFNFPSLRPSIIMGESHMER